MHVLVIGGGGREHAIAWKLAQSPRLTRLSIAPGNAGTAALPRATNLEIDATDIVSLLDYAESEGVDLTVVGPEDPLALGLVDQFEASGQRIFGPRRAAARIETSRSYAKALMQRYGVPTPPYAQFTDLEGALDYVMGQRVDDLVIKADGLARAKGIYQPRGAADAEGILRALLQRDALGLAGRRVIVERRQPGQELSLKAFTDGRTLIPMPPVRDHMRLLEQGQGPTTGGMGAYAPVPGLRREQVSALQGAILVPVLQALQQEGVVFKGVLYASVVLAQDGPVVLELNVRFGDPGAQVVLPLLETDLLDVLEACVDGGLDGVGVRWRDAAAVSVVLAAEGYPHHPQLGLPIEQRAPLPDDVLIFHAGTRLQSDGTLVTAGGRVLNLTGVGPDLHAAVVATYNAVRAVHFDGMRYRTDIGARALGLL